MSNYEYAGYLKSILYAPDPGEAARAESVFFSADDIAKWSVKDFDVEAEWKRIPVHRSRTDQGVRLVGRFEDVTRIDLVPKNAPRFWVPLGTLNLQDNRFPIDLNWYPILEVTYRCASPNASPCLAWTYAGGKCLESLPVTQAMRTVVKMLPWNGFPTFLDKLVLRLYSNSRTTETLEVESIRFRKLTPEEREACDRDLARLDSTPRPMAKECSASFSPLGVTMNADTVRRNAQLLGVSLGEYWDLAMEDIVRHHHNAVILDRAQELSEPEWSDLLSTMAHHGVRLVPQLNLDVENEEYVREAVEAYVRPRAGDDTILAWRVSGCDEDTSLHKLIALRKLVDEADSRHPLAICTRGINSYAALAPHFDISGISYVESHSPWQLGEVVRTHQQLCKGQQFWLDGPAFVYATDTPEWSTCPEMRLMVNLAFANGARGWFSHAYCNDPFWVTGSYQRTLTGPFLTFSDLWLELDRRMERLAAVTPLLLETEPASIPRLWYAQSSIAEDNYKLPEGMAAVSSYRLKGPDFDLFFVVSNDVRGMSALYANIPQDALEGNQIYDLTDFMQERVWKPMNLERHLEMFPGQAQVVLLGRPEVCDRIHHVVSKHLINVDMQQLNFYLKMARTYGLDMGPVEDLLSKATTGDTLIDLAMTDQARDLLVDMIYNTPDIFQPRSHIIEISSALCACDGVLCRMMSRGKVEEAMEWGQRVIPLAREVTRYRIELRRGLGHDITPHTADIVKRTHSLLNELRNLR
ncbi:MAG: hypothetical protein AMXMBFR84_36930 [Candidatus Hydrogenedentota bacterium]